MTVTAKYYAAHLITIAAVGAMLWGLNNIFAAQGPDGVRGAGLLFGGAIVGCVAAVMGRYYAEARKNARDRARIAAETLAGLAKTPPAGAPSPKQHANVR